MIKKVRKKPDSSPSSALNEDAEKRLQATKLSFKKYNEKPDTSVYARRFSHKQDEKRS